MSDTLRTDAAIPTEYNFGEEEGQYVPTEFARTLERELAEAQKEIEGLRFALAHTCAAENDSDPGCPGVDGG